MTYEETKNIALYPMECDVSDSKLLPNLEQKNDYNDFTLFYFDILGDFFKHEGEYDLVLEQTLFCAIDPSKRAEYVKKSSELLAENGKLAGVLFNTHFDGGPPFGGSIEEYNGLFREYLRELSIKECYNSIEPRSGKECFLIAKK